MAVQGSTGHEISVEFGLYSQLLQGSTDPQISLGLSSELQLLQGSTDPQISLGLSSQLLQGSTYPQISFLNEEARVLYSVLVKKSCPLQRKTLPFIGFPRDEFEEILKLNNLYTLYDMKDECYPRVVVEFYSNLKEIVKGDFFHTSVMGKGFLVTRCLINQVLELSLDLDDPQQKTYSQKLSSLGPNICKKFLKEIRKKGTRKDCVTNLNPKSRSLYSFIEDYVTERRSDDLLDDNTLLIFYHIVHEIPFDLVDFIIRSMCKDMRDEPGLPYGRLITRILERVGLDLTGEMPANSDNPTAVRRMSNAPSPILAVNGESIPIAGAAKATVAEVIEISDDPATPEMGNPSSHIPAVNGEPMPIAVAAAKATTTPSTDASQPPFFPPDWKQYVDGEFKSNLIKELDSKLSVHGHSFVLGIAGSSTAEVTAYGVPAPPMMQQQHPSPPPFVYPHHFYPYSTPSYPYPYHYYPPPPPSYSNVFLPQYPPMAPHHLPQYPPMAPHHHTSHPPQPPFHWPQPYQYPYPPPPSHQPVLPPPSPYGPHVTGPQ